MSDPSGHPVTDLFTWLAASDRRALALTLYGEARSEPIEGRIAVASVIRNRAARKFRGRSIADVCLYPSQFSCWSPRGGSENYAHLTAIATAMAAHVSPEWSAMERSIYEETAWIAEGILSGVIRDRVHRALYYMTTKQFESYPPRWAVGATPVAVVGSHSFFRELHG
jgi:spore germination cell wall hydrolase CwlJ-like protein